VPFYPNRFFGPMYTHAIPRPGGSTERGVRISLVERDKDLVFAIYDPRTQDYTPFDEMPEYARAGLERMMGGSFLARGLD